MSLTRRDSIRAGLGALAGATALRGGVLRAEVPVTDVPTPKYEIEEGASLRVLRPAKFVQGDETEFLEIAKRFKAQTGVDVAVESESWEDLRPKTAVSANVGNGPDIVLAWSDDPHKFADKCLDLTDLATYLGDKYGGWYPTAQKYGRRYDKWIAMPAGASGSRLVSRHSWVVEAGYDTFPKDLDGFLDLCRKLQKNKHPVGFAVGNATGDANSWTSWCLWSHGAAQVDEKNQVIINSKETVEALKYGKALYETFIPGTLAWQDPANNKAFLAGEISITANGISVYYSAKTSKDEAMQKIAGDIVHEKLPIGPVGHPTERCLLINSMIFNYTKYPNAAKEFLRFLMEREQYEAWLTASIGYWSQPLRAYEQAAIWDADPKHDAYRTVIADSLWDGYRGDVGPASAAALGDFAVVQMFASVCSGQATPEDAAAQAERQFRRYYRRS